MTTAQTASAQLRITSLATMLPVHRAFHWLHLHQSQLRLWQLEMLAIPSPPFGEQARAAWFVERFQALGLTGVHLDEEGNALGTLPGTSDGPFVLVSAHLDTVFPTGTDTAPREDGSRILGPGACDNAAGLSALLGLISALRFASIVPPVPILFAANVGEEGEGDLRGMRQLFSRGEYASRIGAAIALDGSGTAAAVTRALGSRRFRVTVSGPGGHSWSDADLPNPITLLSRGIAALADLDAFRAGSEDLRSTFSPGIISGGTSINSIPQSATVLLDLRSTDATRLEEVAQEVRRVFAALVELPATFLVESVGERPAGTLPDDSALLHTLRAVDRHLGIRTDLRLGSTDANIPLALGIPALALATGGTGGGIHTLAEWYDPTGRETALRRIFLVILDVARSLIP
jgi:acetylornithine deacetylase/succinyl-diaminopimelate desuccinylase-like protein